MMAKKASKTEWGEFLGKVEIDVLDRSQGKNQKEARRGMKEGSKNSIELQKNEMKRGGLR